LLAFRVIRSRQSAVLPLAATIMYAGGLFGFWLFIYMTRKQSLLVPRYGLIFFALGLPLTAWFLQSLRQNWKPWISNAVVAVMIVFCAREAIRQRIIVSKVLDDFRAQQEIAETLSAAMSGERGSQQRCFSDNPAVRVLSKLPANRFVRSKTTPLIASQNVSAFESYLKDRHVAYLVFLRIEDSLPVKFYPELGNSTDMSSEKFQPITVAFSAFGPAVWLYRVRNEDAL
jgi:hypothetical protein